MEILKQQQQQKCSRSKTLEKMKNPLMDGLLSRLDMAKERISELEDISTEFLKPKLQRE